MKRTFLFMLGLCLVGATAVNGQTIKVASDYPKAGESIKFEGMDLPDGAQVQAFFINGQEFDARDIESSSKDGKVTGAVPTGDKDAAFFLLVKNGEQETVAYQPVMLYQADRHTPVAGAQGSISLGYTRMSRFIGIDNDLVKASELLNAELAMQPTAKEDPFWGPYYATLAMSLNSAPAIEETKGRIEALRKKRKATEKDLVLAMELARVIKAEDADEQKAAADEIIKKYPKGETAMADVSNKFYEEKDVAKKAALFEQWKKMGGKDQTAIDRMAGTLANLYGNQEDYANFDKYLAMVGSPTSKASSLNNVAWNLSGDWPMEEGAKLDKALLQKAANMSYESLRLIKSVIDDPAESKPGYYTANTWKGYMEGNYAMYSDTYALLMYRLGKSDDALKYQQIACENGKFESPDMNERYCVYLEEAQGAAKAEATLADLISGGYATGAMKDQYRRVFAANNTLEIAAAKSLAMLEEKAKAKSLEELKMKMINEPAPSFTLRNMDGQEVSLESLRGKVVVLDFWATWCGPCKASFPGMQRALTNHVDRDDVVFLFVDTWENGKEKLKNASDFITKNKYTFNVLMDDENEVVTKYQVEGIPTKFVLDRSGNIRFKSVGYSGSEDGLVTEMTLMIELAGKPGTVVP